MSKIRGPRFSIPAMPEIASAINEVVEWVEQLPKPKKINAGPNILMHEDEASISIEGAPAGEQDLSTPCTFNVTLEQAEEEGMSTVEVSPFTVNGLLPENLKDIDPVSKTEILYLILNVTTNSDGIVGLKYEILEEFEIKPQYAESKPPTEFAIFAAVIDNNVVRPALCTPISIEPAVAYSDASSTSGSKSYYYWKISSAEIFLT